MTRSYLVLGLLVVTGFALPAGALVAAVTPAVTTNNTTNTKPVAETAVKPVVKTAVKPAAKTVVTKVAQAPKSTSRFEVELTGFTSETSDQLFGRFNVSKSRGPRKWFVRPGYLISTSRSYSKNKVYKTVIDTFTLDSQYRQDKKSSYNFISATSNIKTRTTGKYEKDGYYMVSAGVGRRIMPGIEGELSLSAISRYDDEVDRRVKPVYTLRLKSPLSDAMTLDGETLFAQPFASDVLVDSRLNLTYKLSSVVSMRLSYIADNMSTPISSASGWDKSFRVSLVFSKADSN